MNTKQNSLPEDDYVFVPIDQAAVSPGGLVNHIINSWWTVHPDKGLVFYNPINIKTGRRRHRGFGGPMYNTDERIVRLICSKATPWAEVRFVESVFLKHRCEE